MSTINHYIDTYGYWVPIHAMYICFVFMTFSIEYCDPASKHEALTGIIKSILWPITFVVWVLKGVYRVCNSWSDIPDYTDKKP